MKSKYVYILIIAYTICISAGIFIEITTPSTDISIFSQSIESFFETANLSQENFLLLILEYIKDDFFYVVAVLFLSVGIITLPVSIILSLTKVFSMGFGAAFIISTFNQSFIKILFAGIFPRCFLRIPLYFLITIVSVKISKTIYSNTSLSAMKAGLKPHLLKLLLLFILMVISSIIEVCLLVVVL